MDGRGRDEGRVHPRPPAHHPLVAHAPIALHARAHLERSLLPRARQLAVGGVAGVARQLPGPVVEEPHLHDLGEVRDAEEDEGPAEGLPPEVDEEVVLVKAHFGVEAGRSASPAGLHLMTEGDPRGLLPRPRGKWCGRPGEPREDLKL